MELPVSDETKKNLTEKNTWMRGVYMLLFIVVDIFFVRVAIHLIALVQFVVMLFTSGANEKLTELGYSVSTFSYQIMLYVTYNSDSRPFPFDEVWPEKNASSSKSTKKK